LRGKVLSFNSLLPVPVIEKRPLPEQYLTGVVQRRFDVKKLYLTRNDNENYEIQAGLIPFETRERFWQKATHFNDYSFKFDHSWRADRYAPSSLKTNLKFSGTYDMNGKIISLADKGIYIDQFL